MALVAEVSSVFVTTMGQAFLKSRLMIASMLQSNSLG